MSSFFTHRRRTDDSKLATVQLSLRSYSKRLLIRQGSSLLVRQGDSLLRRREQRSAKLHAPRPHCRVVVVFLR